MPNSVVKTLTVNGTTYDLKDVDSESYAPKASPALTGTPTAPTATSGTNTTQIATTAFVQGAVSTAIGNVNSFNISVVQSLPTTNIDTHTIYFISNSGSTGNIYDEYMYINNNWEKIGTTDVDLSGYLAKNNTTAFTPSGDYNPATKKYVDDAVNGFSTTLSGLSDTTIASASNGQILTYNSTSSKWENINLPSDAFVITVTSTTENDVTTYSADKTFAEITAAHNAGKVCVLVNNSYVYTLKYISASKCYFVSTYYIGIKRLEYRTIIINNDDTVELVSTPFFSYEGSNNAYPLKTLIAQVNGNANTTSITGSLDYSTTAYRAYNAGDLFWLDNKTLAKATTSIASGATLTLNTNYVKTTIEEELKLKPTTLVGLTDTTITTPSDGQGLLYDSTTSKWVNGDVADLHEPEDDIEVLNLLSSYGYPTPIEDGDGDLIEDADNNIILG